MNVFQVVAGAGVALMVIVALVLMAPWLAEKITRRPQDVGDTWPSRAAQDAPVNKPAAPQVNWDELAKKSGAKRGAR
jgi:hypothetical protein